MPDTPAGWFDDGSGQLRWWDGDRWSDYYYETSSGAVVDRGTSVSGPTAFTSRSRPVRWSRQLPTAVIAISVVMVVVLLTSRFYVLLLLVGLVAGLTGLIAVLNGSFLRMRIRSRRAASVVLVAGILVSTVGGTALAAGGPPPIDSARETRPTPTETATSTPPQETTIVEERTAVPYSSSTVDDPNLDVGNRAVVTSGVNGEKLTRIRVVTEYGREIERSVIDESMSLHPVNEVIAVGTRQPPPPPPPPAPAPVPAEGGCDPNYAGSCVPIAYDVDCAGGSGDGPEYAFGPVQIIGQDIYDLDRDGDGIACDA